MKPTDLSVHVKKPKRVSTHRKQGNALTVC